MEFRFDVKFGLVEYNIEWGLVFFGKGSYGLGFKGGFDGGLGGFGFYWFEFYIKFRFYVW